MAVYTTSASSARSTHAGMALGLAPGAATTSAYAGRGYGRSNSVNIPGIWPYGAIMTSKNRYLRDAVLVPLAADPPAQPEQGRTGQKQQRSGQRELRFCDQNPHGR